MSVHHRIGQPPGLSSQHVLDEGGLGVLASLIPTTGEHGGSVLANEAADAGNAGKELRAVVTSAPSGDDLVSFIMYSDGSFDLELTEGVDATYTIDYTAYADGVSLGAATAEVDVGAGGDPPGDPSPPLPGGVVMTGLVSGVLFR